VGRTAELESIIQRLTGEHARLLTLIGPAGVGKTRLALEVLTSLADRFADGAAFVDLAPVRDARQVLPAMAQLLGLIDTGARPLPHRLRAYLAERELLLVLDNFEQVLPAAVQLPELLAAAPGLRLLVTSRVHLRLRAEQTIRVLPLPVPEPDGVPPLPELLQIPAVALFVERAQAQRADFQPSVQQASHLIQVTRQLDGLPLAIELAAGQASVLPIAVIAHRLDQQLQSLQWEAHDLPERQRSLQAAIDWSYALLPPAEQRLFRQLGVFVRRVALAAIDAVSGVGDEERTLDGLIALAEKSLVLPGRLEGEEPEPAFGMLETVRQYAVEQLAAAGELHAARQAHAAYFLRLAERAEPELRGHVQLSWLARLEAEHDNLRAALRWLLENKEFEQALQLAGALGNFWWLRGYFAEGAGWLEEALTKASAAPSIRTRALSWTGLLLAARDDPEPSMAALREALALAEAQADRPAIALSSMILGASSNAAGKVAEGERLLREALALWEGLGDSYHIGYTLASLAYVPLARGEYQEAAELYAAALARWQGIGELMEVSQILLGAALPQIRLGDHATAVQLVQDALRGSLAHRARWVVSVATEVTLLLLRTTGEVERRVRLLGARDALAQATGLRTGILEPSSGLSLDELRLQVAREEIQRAYRAGRALDLLEEFSTTRAGGQKGVRQPAVASPLSGREHEVLRLVAEGLTNRQIAAQLFLSPRTIDHHLTSIFNKLGVDTRAQAVAVAARDGLV
jgi:predicted ATPase/DNA-binding CsgD family transcriptional regulator